MDKTPIDSAVVPDFLGMFSNADPADCPEGSLYRQINMMTITPGQLTTRGGLKLISLDELE